MDVQTQIIYCPHCGKPRQVERKNGRLLGLKRIRCCGAHLELSRRGLCKPVQQAPPIARPFAVWKRTEEQWVCHRRYASIPAAVKSAKRVAVTEGLPAKIVLRRSGRWSYFFPAGWNEPYDGPWCRVCGCTPMDCSGCIERTGEPCSWVEPDLCSACVGKAFEHVR